MKNFDQWMGEHQVAWRRIDPSMSQTQGAQNGKERDWILPMELWEQGLWWRMQNGADWPLQEYLDLNRVKRHDGAHNLKSSWTHCANMYFPFGRSDVGKRLLAGFLKHHVNAAVNSVDAVELEYAADADLHPSKLLGETGGTRGVNQTSPDLGIVVNGGQGLILTENKLVERSFYPCSGHWYKGAKTKPANPDPSRCDNPLAGLSASTQCQQVSWGRRYWEHLAPVVNTDMLARLTRCPARDSGYQLFRQQALAEGIAASGTYDFVVSTVAMDERNTSLLGCLRPTGINSVHNWGTLFRGKAHFAMWNHQQWVTWVNEHDEAGDWADWLQYVRGRYRYTV